MFPGWQSPGSSLAGLGWERLPGPQEQPADGLPEKWLQRQDRGQASPEPPAAHPPTHPQRAQQPLTCSACKTWQTGQQSCQGPWASPEPRLRCLGVALQAALQRTVFPGLPSCHHQSSCSATESQLGLGAQQRVVSLTRGSKGQEASLPRDELPRPWFEQTHFQKLGWRSGRWRRASGPQAVSPRPKSRPSSFGLLSSLGPRLPCAQVVG